jgi:endonuclease G
MILSLSLRVLFLITLGLTTVSCKKETQVETVSSTAQPNINISARAASDNMLMGNPSGATTSTAATTNYLMQKTQYSLSYNSVQGKPNWVSWHLDPTWLGAAARCDCFASDATLPTGWYRVGSTSYSGSGFDRGHMCPSADRDLNSSDNAATFLMTNMAPQAPMNNQRTWVGLENYERALVGQGNECYIICGSYGVGGTGSNGGVTNTINNGRITVPSNIWKVILVIPQGTGDIARVTTSTRVIAINTPNVNSVNTNWAVYRTSVDAIEVATGYNLLSALPASVQSVIEARTDNGPTQ